MGYQFMRLKLLTCSLYLCLLMMFQYGLSQVSVSSTNADSRKDDPNFNVDWNNLLEIGTSFYYQKYFDNTGDGYGYQYPRERRFDFGFEFTWLKMIRKKGFFESGLIFKREVHVRDSIALSSGPSGSLLGYQVLIYKNLGIPIHIGAILWSHNSFYLTGSTGILISKNFHRTRRNHNYDGSLYSGGELWDFDQNVYSYSLRLSLRKRLKNNGSAALNYRFLRPLNASGDYEAFTSHSLGFSLSVFNKR